MSNKKRYGKKSDTIKKIISIGIIILLIIIAAVVGLEIYNMPDKKINREIDRLAAAYYEERFYPSYLASLNDTSVEEGFSKYQDTALQPVYLRQLLAWSREQGNDVDEIFNNTHYRCNTNTSKVIYQPVAPFGKKDYTYTYDLSCKEW